MIKIQPNFNFHERKLCNKTNKFQIFCEGLSGKFSSASYFFENKWRFQKCFCFARKTLKLSINVTLMKFNFHLVQNLYSNIKQEIFRFQNCKKTTIFQYSVAPKINFTARKAIEIQKCQNCRLNHDLAGWLSENCFIRLPVNILLLPISLIIHENSKKAFVLQ